jgi:hypothetical protein
MRRRRPLAVGLLTSIVSAFALTLLAYGPGNGRGALESRSNSLGWNTFRCVARALVCLLVTLPLISGRLPAPASERAASSSSISTIRFSGYTWRVKASRTPVGPGPNRFSGRAKNVWLDSRGRLHLGIVKRSGSWYCSEVVNTASLGYGSYYFTLAGRVDRLDRNAVLGLFTWDDTSAAYSHREIDIELSRWGDPSAANAQYVVQPWQKPGHEHRFRVRLGGDLSTYRFTWSPRAVRFTSYRGRPGARGKTIQSWTFAGGGVPRPGSEHARLNLWLMDGEPPSRRHEVEVIVQSFRFVPRR